MNLPNAEDQIVAMRWTLEHLLDAVEKLGEGNEEVLARVGDAREALRPAFAPREDSTG